MALDTTKTAHEIITSGRSTGQTVIDSDGNLKWAMENLVDTRLSDTDEWTQLNLASVALSGTNVSGAKRYLITEDTSAGVSHYVNRPASVDSGRTYTFSAVVQSNGRDAAISTGSAFGSERWSFDLSTLTATKQSGTSTTATATATALTNGEVLIEFTATATSTGGVAMQFRLWNGVGSDTAYDGDGTSGIYMSEAKVYQSTIGPIATSLADAMQRDKNGSNFLENETGAALYGLGIDYSTGRGGLQVYEGRTNLVSYFEVSEANWVIDGTGLRTDQNLSVLGAFKGCLVQSQGNTFDGVRNSGSFSVTSGLDYAVSFMWSDSDSNSIGFRVFEAAVGVSVANVTTAGVLTQTDVTKGTIVLGSHVEILPGLYRTTVVWTPNFTGDGLIAAGPNSATIGDSILLYCGSIEAGSFASPLIPTYGSTVTRAFDNMTTLVSSFGYNVNAGTVVCDFVSFDEDTSGVQNVFNFSDGTTSNRAIARRVNTASAMFVVSGGEVVANFAASGLSVGVASKVAMGIEANNFAQSLDGAAVVKDTDGAMPSGITELRYGWAVVNPSTATLNGLIYSLAYYPFAASDAQLVEASS